MAALCAFITFALVAILVVSFLFKSRPLASMLVVLLSLASLANAADCKRCRRQLPKPAPISADEQNRALQEKVDLPHDEQRPYLTIFGEPSEPAFRSLVASFDAEPLNCIRDVCHYNVIPTDLPTWPCYAANTTQLPCVRLQLADGSVLYEATGERVPSDPSELAKALECWPVTDATYEAADRGFSIRVPGIRVERHCDRCRRDKEPAPAPAPAPVPKPDPAPQPLTAPKVEARKPPFPTLVLVGTVLGCVVVGAGGAYALTPSQRN